MSNISPIRWADMSDDDDFVFEGATGDLPSFADENMTAHHVAQNADFIGISPIKSNFVTPSRGTVHGDGTVPYKLKSLCTAPPTVHATPNPGRVVQRPDRNAAAVAEVEQVLYAAGGSLKYTELVKAARWRERFQTPMGSMFTFLKKHHETFAYNNATVSLVQDQDDMILRELLRDWK